MPTQFLYSIAHSGSVFHPHESRARIVMSASVSSFTSRRACELQGWGRHPSFLTFWAKLWPRGGGGGVGGGGCAETNSRSGGLSFSFLSPAGLEHVVWGENWDVVFAFPPTPTELRSNSESNSNLLIVIPWSIVYWPVARQERLPPA